MGGWSAWGMILPRPPASRFNARSTAAEILDRVEAGRGHSNALLAAIPPAVDDRERALTTEIVYGVLRRRRVLDALLAGVSSRPLTEIDAPVLTALRVAIYQILFLTRVPRSAAVNEAVSLVRARRGQAPAAFANAVLRAACRAIDEGRVSPPERPGPDPQPGELVAYLESTQSFPRFLVERFLEQFGASECEALLKAFNRPAPIVLRPARRGEGADALAGALAREGITTIASPVLEGALRVVRGSPQHSALFRGGGFYIQDEASQIVARLLLPLSAGENLIDLCAAPGGKVLALAESLPTEAGIVIAADVSLTRLKSLSLNAHRMGVDSILAVAMDVTRPAVRARFHRILLDAPCSGTGIIRRHPEIRWRRSADDIERFARLQDEALLAASELLAPGGRLVYAVCSLEPEEGPDRVAALLRARRQLTVVDARSLLTGTLRRLVDESGYLRTLPHRDDLDGFFAAVIVRSPEP